MNVGVVGSGLVGTRRARVAEECGDRVLVAADLDLARARELAPVATTDWQEVVAHPEVETVVVATFNTSAHGIVLAALGAGKHVLCEKPLGTSAAEADDLRRAARRHGRVLKTGFNHRHHPALSRAHELAASGAIGELASIRAAYGHGGRPGYEREWRADPRLSGGGELLDQGVHLVDLCRWFLGEFTEVAAMLQTSCWPVEPLEDNAFALLRTADGRVASLHTSWTQWRNIFRFEVFGRDGYLAVDGLGGSYGIERLTHGTRNAEGGRPEETTQEFTGPDESWRDEWLELKAAIADGRQPLGSGDDGYEAARIVDGLYRAAERGGLVSLEEAA